MRERSEVGASSGDEHGSTGASPAVARPAATRHRNDSTAANRPIGEMLKPMNDQGHAVAAM
jgi:hypothetical protein